MERPITTRIPEEVLMKLKEIALKENLDVSTVIRRFLASAMKEWNREFILKQLENSEISIGKAAEELNISVWDVMDLIKKYQIKWPNYSKEDLENELKSIGLHKK
jgi:predicted HTH domain antitoxin